MVKATALITAPPVKYTVTVIGLKSGARLQSSPLILHATTDNIVVKIR